MCRGRKHIEEKTLHPEFPPQRLGPKIASDTAKILDEAKIPNFVWEWIELAPIGLPRAHVEIQFIIPDIFLVKAATALTAAKLKICKAGPECRQINDIPTSEPDMHFHHHPHPHEVISLMKQSSMAWKLDITLESPAKNDPDFMLSNDPRFSGHSMLFSPIPSGMYPFKMLTPARLTECYLLLLCRDVDIKTAVMLKNYLGHLLYIKKHVQGPKWFTEEDIHPRFRPLWRELDQETLSTIYDQVRKLRVEIGENGFKPSSGQEIKYLDRLLS
ncbi:hypothetical protein EYZ11_000939 [Aspergillus tanneri]|uniref:Uncharacterized protein n=1 Tax=Aspergillus tanneri TaxID=1220188 RepID=A0A4V3UQL2_9EURO|nr:uncharacterized protein ATNIH1004_000240 [Aspergillus tanneri]KAA8651358.1 hypothetical protein ATNIH1004_000240 [Aspergillus tanneri]THC99570.1 hypothetical protein EYZ11_000939 [Aspergillus tanneri]